MPPDQSFNSAAETPQVPGFSQDQQSTDATQSGPKKIPRRRALTMSVGQRTVKFFSVSASELASITTAQNRASIFRAIGASSLSLAVGIRMQDAYAEKTTPVGELLSGAGFWVLIAVAVIAGLISVFEAKQSQDIVTIIKNETDE